MWIPSYWNFRGRPLKMVRSEDGGSDILWLNAALEWQRDNMALAAILNGDPDADQVSEGDFERWVAALQAGLSEEAAWEVLLAQSSSLIEGVVEARDEVNLLIRGKWWKAEGGLLPSIRTGDWVQLRLTPDGAIITELRPAQQSDG